MLRQEKNLCGYRKPLLNFVEQEILCVPSRQVDRRFDMGMDGLLKLTAVDNEPVQVRDSVLFTVLHPQALHQSRGLIAHSLCRGSGLSAATRLEGSKWTKRSTAGS
jgi:hypothetical protein